MILSAFSHARHLIFLLPAALGTPAVGCSPWPRTEPPADTTTSGSESIRTSASGSVAIPPESAPSPVPTPVPTSPAKDSAVAKVTKAAEPAPAPDTAPAAHAEAPAAPTSDDEYLQYDAATNTVTFKLVAGPFAFNGYTGGGATLTVPPRSTNVMIFEQADGTPHSAEIGSGTGEIPNSGGDPAIPRAYTNKAVEGLIQGAKDVMRFTAPDSGTYRIVCGVPGHALSAMWIWYQVDPAARTPSFRPTPK